MASDEHNPSRDRVPFFKHANRVVLKTVFLAAVTIGVVFTFHTALQHAVIPGINKTLSSWSSMIAQLIRDTTVNKTLFKYIITTPATSLHQMLPPPDVLVCRTPQCQNFLETTARRLRGSKFNPCHDFYSYVCASWEQEHPLKRHRIHSVSFDSVTVEHYLQILKASLKSMEPQSKLGLVYNLCQKKSDTLFSELVQTFLYTLGLDHWPYTAHSARDVSAEELSYKVGSVYRELGLDTLFSFSINEDEENREFLELT
ncbi:conserved hypothetical protein [Ixodes scapularis]|uniref:Peptidase M13 N-terminal domain-containing protein n=1 Tax=Ixodes scapularis TaxID=6945 RepID=B7P8L9_IXOSC|nr:conserved hypothetical protein [Ixodes scapularis]|eukprot:XP_002402482.1 conserved hypothetical protein [Ixodes scapularis]